VLAIVVAHGDVHVVRARLRFDSSPIFVSQVFAASPATCYVVMVASRSFCVLAAAACQSLLASAARDGQTDYVINVKPPQEEDGDVFMALDGVMRDAESARSAANAEFAEGKRRMLEAERAELRRIVRASGR
jgi:hypothetical protein